MCKRHPGQGLGQKVLCCGYLMPGSQGGELSSRECSGADWNSLAVLCATETCLQCRGCAVPRPVDNGVKGHSGSLQSQLEPVKSNWSGHHPVSFCVSSRTGIVLPLWVAVLDNWVFLSTVLSTECEIFSKILALFYASRGSTFKAGLSLT